MCYTLDLEAIKYPRELEKEISRKIAINLVKLLQPDSDANCLKMVESVLL